MVLRILSPLEGILTLLLIQGLYYSALSSIPAFPVFSLHAFVLQQAEVTLMKSTGEAFSYAYYKAVEGNFDASAYSDDPNENWNAPTWFKDPKGKVNCAVYDGNIGCVVWNLTGGNDPSDPCPDVVPYTPNPRPNLTPTVSASSVEGYFNQLAAELNSLLSERGVTVSASISPSISRTYRMNVAMSYDGSAGYLRKSEAPSFTWVFTERNWIGPAGTAVCECDYGSGYETVATYELNGLYFGLVGTVDGVKLLEENAVYIRYFASVKKKSVSGNLVDCRMVIR